MTEPKTEAEAKARMAALLDRIDGQTADLHSRVRMAMSDDSPALDWGNVGILLVGMECSIREGRELANLLQEEWT